MELGFRLCDIRKYTNVLCSRETFGSDTNTVEGGAIMGQAFLHGQKFGKNVIKVNSLTKPGGTADYVIPEGKTWGDIEYMVVMGTNYGGYYVTAIKHTPESTRYSWYSSNGSDQTAFEFQDNATSLYDLAAANVVQNVTFGLFVFK